MWPIAFLLLLPLVASKKVRRPSTRSENASFVVVKDLTLYHPTKTIRAKNDRECKDVCAKWQECRVARQHLREKCELGVVYADVVPYLQTQKFPRPPYITWVKIVEEGPCMRHDMEPAEYDVFQMEKILPIVFRGAADYNKTKGNGTSTVSYNGTTEAQKIDAKDSTTTPSTTPTTSSTTAPSTTPTSSSTTTPSATPTSSSTTTPSTTPTSSSTTTPSTTPTTSSTTAPSTTPTSSSTTTPSATQTAAKEPNTSAKPTFKSTVMKTSPKTKATTAVSSTPATTPKKTTAHAATTANPTTPTTTIAMPTTCCEADMQQIFIPSCLPKNCVTSPCFHLEQPVGTRICQKIVVDSGYQVVYQNGTDWLPINTSFLFCYYGKPNWADYIAPSRKFACLKL